MLRFLALPQRFVVLPKGDALSPSLEGVVEKIWQAERRRRGSKLFNGTVFSVDECADGTVMGRFIEYRRFLAQVQRPDLFPELQVRPLAVTGLLQNAEGLFFGRRNPGAAQQPDCWELVPAGGIDRTTLTNLGEVDPREQILLELQEEVGLDRGSVARPRLVAFCEEPEHHVFDLVWELETSLKSIAVTTAQAKLSNPEHQQILCIRWKDVAGFLADHQATLAAGIFDLINHIAPQKQRMSLKSY
jgi:hypothetical protein